MSYPPPTTTEAFLSWFEQQRADQIRCELVAGVVRDWPRFTARQAMIRSELGFRISDGLKRAGRNARALFRATVPMPPDSAPDPDIVVAVLQPGENYIPVRSVLLIVDTLVTQVPYEHLTRRTVYARSLVPEVWAIDLDAAHVCRFWDPSGGRYRNQDESRLSSGIRSVTIPDLLVETDKLN
jgi:hypothetical protein